MMAAVVDNPLGELSVFVAPPNVIRNLELKYSRLIMKEDWHARAGQHIRW